jgi:hypothetical protein
LFAIHNLIDKESKEVFSLLGLPPTDIPVTDGAPVITAHELVPRLPVSREGSLYLEFPFANLDPGWAMSGMAELLRKAGIIHTAPFTRAPPVLAPFEEKENLLIAIIGDWGTGDWQDGTCPPPAKLVADAIRQINPAPDILIHLGDVYYSGREREETDRLLNGFPGAGSGYNFTLNSNHEMYSGANGYFGDALNHPLFIHQNHCSYFAIKYRHWIIIGLDSAYYDNSFMVSKGALSNSDNQYQQDFIQNLNIQPDDLVIVLTHHPGIDFDGNTILPLFTEINSALHRSPDYWYYGHIHDGIVYDEHSIAGDASLKTYSGTYPRLRCVGHSSIPYGCADLDNHPGVPYFAHTKYPENTAIASDKRVLNGFATIKLTADHIQEKMFEVSPADGLLEKWSNG